jgi:hypothetical protein
VHDALTVQRGLAATLAAVTMIAGADTVRAATPTPPTTADNHTLVGGAVGVAFTRNGAECALKGGKPISFQTPDTMQQPAPPDVTAMLEGGVWVVEVHTPSPPRDFQSDDAAGVVVDSMPGGNWRVELHNIKMDERETMATNYAFVSGIITCTSYVNLDTLGAPQ